MAINFNELSTTAPVPTKDEVDNKIDKISGIVPIGNLLKIANDGGVEDSGIAYTNVAKKTDIPTLVGVSMPDTPTQNELAEAVKKIFEALGGTITTNVTQNVEVE